MHRWVHSTWRSDPLASFPQTINFGVGWRCGGVYGGGAGKCAESKQIESVAFGTNVSC